MTTLAAGAMGEFPISDGSIKGDDVVFRIMVITVYPTPGPATCASFTSETSQRQQSLQHEQRVQR